MDHNVAKDFGTPFKNTFVFNLDPKRVTITKCYNKLEKKLPKWVNISLPWSFFMVIFTCLATLWIWDHLFSMLLVVCTKSIHQSSMLFETKTCRGVRFSFNSWLLNKDRNVFRLLKMLLHYLFLLYLSTLSPLTNHILLTHKLPMDHLITPKIVGNYVAKANTHLIQTKLVPFVKYMVKWVIMLLFVTVDMTKMSPCHQSQCEPPKFYEAVKSLEWQEAMQT